MNLIILILITLITSTTHTEESTSEILRPFLPHLSTEEHKENIIKKGSPSFWLNKLYEICDHYQLPHDSFSNPFNSGERRADRIFQNWSPAIAQWSLKNGSTVIFLAEDHANNEEAEWLQKKIETTEINTRIYENAPLFGFLFTTLKKPTYKASQTTKEKIYDQFKEAIPVLKTYNRDYYDLCGPDDTETLYRMIIEEPKLTEKWNAQIENLNTILKNNSIAGDPTDRDMIEICEKIGINGYDFLNLCSQFFTEERKLSNLLNKIGIQQKDLPEDYDTNTLYQMIVEKLIHYIRDGYMIDVLSKEVNKESNTEPKIIVIQRGSYHLGNSWRGLEHVLGKGTITFCPLMHVTTVSEDLRKKEIISPSPTICGLIIEMVNQIEQEPKEAQEKLIQLFDKHILSHLTRENVDKFNSALDTLPTTINKELRKTAEKLNQLI